MDIIIKRAILHILDFQSNMTVISNQWLDLSDPIMLDFVVKHVENSFKDSGRHRGEFQPQSRFSQMVHQYLNNELDLISLSSTAATMLHDEIIQSDSLDSVDVMMVELSRGEEQYLGLLCFQNKMGYTHQVFSSEDGVRNEIMRHYSILPNTSQKLSSYAFIKLSDLKVSFADKTFYIDDLFATSAGYYFLGLMIDNEYTDENSYLVITFDEYGIYFNDEEVNLNGIRLVRYLDMEALSESIDFTITKK